ncbi:MAG: hypothetical protein KC416_10140, partial [Myxococcales bacterium]|nr:hypothetical protein [Myxococcales bacterium]
KAIKRITTNGFKAAFLPFHKKQAIVRRVSRDLERFHEDGTIDPPVLTGTEAGLVAPTVSERPSQAAARESRALSKSH